MDSLQSFRSAADLSSSALSFLNDKLGTRESVTEAPTIVSELQIQCSDLDQSLLQLNRRLGASLRAYSLFSGRIHDLFDGVNSKLGGLGSSIRSSAFISGKGDGKSEKMLGEDLPALAKEVARVETVRTYVETALKLDKLIGDIEDAVSFILNKNQRRNSSTQNLDEMRLIAIRTLTMTEEILTSITKSHPKWTHLVSAVDHRVDRALAVLRPQAVADHRALLASLGWPPSLSSLTSNSDARDGTKLPCPLLNMQGDLKLRYCENFLALCHLQELQRQRKSRQLEGHDRDIAMHQPLWVIEELVNPISLTSQHHFSKWIDKPEFIFALVYKFTRDYIDSMDELLQPLVDEAKLVGYSCREEWISAMVTSLSTYMAKEVFPAYIGKLDEEKITGIRSARVSWLNLIDLMINFDKQVRSLVEQDGILLSFEDDLVLQKISSVMIFCDHEDWLDLWAEIELNDALDKLKSVTEDECSWTKKVQAALLSSPEDYKAPLVSSAFLQHLASIIDRCRSFPNCVLRSRFIRIAGLPIIQKFKEVILTRCQEAEGLTALTNDIALIEVAISINAAHYFELVLKEWLEDLFFLEMGGDQVDFPNFENINNDRLMGNLEKGILDEEITKFEEFREEWVDKISVVILRGFDALCRDYMKNRKQWKEKGEEAWAVSKSLIVSLDHLQGKLIVLEESLNSVDFVGVWRSLAAGIDRSIFTGIFMSNVRFYNRGVEKLGADVEVLFGVFRRWCLRPEGFFPRVSEGLKLLMMSEQQLQNLLAGGEKWMRENGIKNLSPSEAETIVKNKVFVD